MNLTDEQCQQLEPNQQPNQDLGGQQQPVLQYQQPGSYQQDDPYQQPNQDFGYQQPVQQYQQPGSYQQGNPYQQPNQNLGGYQQPVQQYQQPGSYQQGNPYQQSNNYWGGYQQIYYTVDTAGRQIIDGLCCCFCFCLIGIIVATSMWIYYEIKSANDLSEIKMISSNLVYLPTGQQGVDEIQNNPAFYNGKIIYLGGVQLNPSNVVDSDFNFNLNAGSLNRFIEYCQWQEYTFQTSSVVGRTANGSAIYQNVVTYTHSLTWTSTQVNSILFKGGYYYNPPVNTLRPMTYYGTTALGQKQYQHPLLVSAANIKLQVAQRVPLSLIDLNSVAARQYGFRAYDGTYYYSQYGGIGTQCIAGSVRIRFESQAYFNHMSFIGRLNNYNLNKVNNLLLNVQGYMSAQDLIKYSQEEAIYSRNVARIFAFVFFALTGSLIAFYCASRHIHLKKNQVKNAYNDIS